MSQIALFPPPSSPTWSVSELTRYLRELLESDHNLQDIWVEGEVSNLSRPSSGHLYFTLKDGRASLRCVVWRSTASRLRFIPQEGEAVEAHGKVSVYEAGGQYQLYVDLLRPAGEGALYQQFLRLKAKLEAEGLFEPARKRPIPQWPRRIGVVTSPTGAALQDILNTLRRRYPLAEVVLSPTMVQGEQAPPGIVAALRALNHFAQPDVILVARGGGSIEDLWAFNDESVARAIAASAAPVISGVGHETDFTLADFAADLRAPTPTAAAELATPDQNELRQQLADSSRKLHHLTLARITQARQSLAHIHIQLRLHSPQARIRSDRQRLDESLLRAETAIRHRMQMQRAHLHGLSKQLRSLNPLAVLERGFAVVSHLDGQIVRSVTQVAAGDLLDVRVADGSFSTEVQK